MLFPKYWGPNFALIDFKVSRFTPSVDILSSTIWEYFTYKGLLLNEIPNFYLYKKQLHGFDSI